MRDFRRLTLSVIILSLSCASFVSAYSGGTGESDNPYQIANKDDLLALAANTADYGKCFILTADINLAGVTLTPVGNSSTPFTGVFDGNDNIISKAVIYQPSSNFVGLFGYIGSSGQIRNLGVEEVNITGGYTVSGLVGYNAGTLTSCYAAGSVSGTGGYVGGLVGDNYYGILTSCHATGSVTGTGQYVGGLVGYNYSGSLVSCYSTGDVTGTSDVGGLVGENYGSITSCYAAGSVSGTGGYVGGLVGYNSSGSLTSCYATGSVRGGSPVGGLVGWNYVGTLNTCFWDMETSGQSKSAGGKGLTTSQMKSISIYQNACWADKGWVINDGLDYPRLSWENTGGVPIPQPQPVPLLGSGSEQDPYQIWTADDFVLLSWYVCIQDKHLVLMTNLDLSGIVLSPIGGDLGPFTGVFDGNNNIISNADINQPASDYVGLFGNIGSGGQIRNLGVEDVNITGRNYVGGLVGRNNSGSLVSCYATGSVCGGDRVGGLVGSNSGSLTSCYATGSVSGSNAGGLVGYNQSGSIGNCYATGSVTGTGQYVGGLVGYNYSGSLVSCYSTGDVTGISDVGGLVGENYGSITSCYATGDVNGTSDVGGLVGDNAGSLTTCYATGSVKGTGQYVGGLVGDNYYGILTSCHATGSVTGTSYVGGLVGDNDGTVTACYATGSVNGTYAVGGLVGNNEYGTLTACYATGSVKGTGQYVGGLVGYNYRGKVIRCYSTGNPTGNSSVGGLCGSKDTGSGYKDTGNFWDTNTSKKLTSAMGIGKTTAEMKTLSTFTSAGWDFTNETINGPNDTWRMCMDGVDYPRLNWEFTEHGDLVCPDGVNFVDFAYFAARWQTTDCNSSNNFCGGTDMDFSGTVDLQDLAIFATNWLNGE